MRLARIARRIILGASLLAVLPGGALAQSPAAIYIMRIDGSEVRKVAEQPDYKSLGHPRWSHDGRRIAFHGWEGPQGARRIFVAQVDAERAPTEGPAGQLVDWSPDDKQLAFQAPGDNGQGLSTWVGNVDGQTRTLLSPGTSPRWSPDGSHLAFIENRQLQVRDLVDESQAALTDNSWPSVRDGFCWSADGKRIAFVGQRDGATGLWIVNVNNPPPKLRLKSAVMGHVAWSPDDKQLAIALNDKIQLLNANDATPPRPIPGQIGNSRDPAWSPDGKWIAFSGRREAK